MKMIFFTLFIATVMLSSECYGKQPFSAVVNKIIDGDSIIVKTAKKKIEIRLYGIDCPEWQQPFATAARKYTRSLIYKKKVMVAPQYYDSYGRLVAVVYKDGQVLNEKLVDSGMAWVYSRYCRKKICKTWRDAQQRAKREKRGLWQMKNPVSPWKWRHRRK